MITVEKAKELGGVEKVEENLEDWFQGVSMASSISQLKDAILTVLFTMVVTNCVVYHT